MRRIVQMRNLLKPLLIVMASLSLMVGLAAEEKSSEENKWSGDAAVSLALARGNTDTTNFSLTLSAKGPLSKSLDSTNKAFFLLSKEEKLTHAESLSLESQISWHHTERFFSYCEILGLRDRFKNYSYRFLSSIGIGYKVMTTEKIQLSANAGISEVFTKYHDSGDTDSYTGIALGNQFTWKISQSSEITQTLDINSDFSELSHYFLRFDISLASAITKGLSVKLTLMDSYDNNPIGKDIKKNDVSFLAGLSAKF